jgi:hypothetical protein
MFQSTSFARATLPAIGAHFCILCATTAMESEQSLAFGELVVSVFLPVELSVYLPESPCPNSPSTAITNEFAVTEAAPEPRGGMGIGSGPVPLVIRLLESYVVAVARPGQIT